MYDRQGSGRLKAREQEASLATGGDAHRGGAARAILASFVGSVGVVAILRFPLICGALALRLPHCAQVDSMQPLHKMHGDRHAAFAGLRSVQGASAVLL